MSNTAPSALLCIDSVSKRFGGVQALQAVSFELENGEILGLIGPNGAGKTTLFDILTGFTTADQGECRLNGQSLAGLQPEQVVRRGVARTFQSIRLFESLTVAEHIMAGLHPVRCASAWRALRPRRLTAHTAQREEVARLMDLVGLSGAPNRLATDLSYGDRRRLEIARALATRPCVLALDEPAAGMNPSETAVLARLLEQLRSQGLSIVVIEHDMRFVMGLSDRIAVLDSGRLLALDQPARVRANPLVIEAYLGRSNDA